MAATKQKQGGVVKEETVSDLRKAAILLVSLDKSAAGEILKHLEESKVETVTREIAHLTEVSEEQRRTVIEEFHSLALARTYSEGGGLGCARALLQAGPAQG